jgi:HrpA-like RNA helicase
MVEIVAVCEQLEGLRLTPKLKIIPIHGDLPDEEQAQIFVKEPNVTENLYIHITFV